jgi:hypothetical protein
MATQPLWMRDRQVLQQKTVRGRLQCTFSFNTTKTQRMRFELLADCSTRVHATFTSERETISLLVFARTPLLW